MKMRMRKKIQSDSEKISRASLLSQDKLYDHFISTILFLKKGSATNDSVLHVFVYERHNKIVLMFNEKC